MWWKVSLPSEGCQLFEFASTCSSGQRFDSSRAASPSLGRLSSETKQQALS